jgi:hypothetical protein
MFRLVLKRSWTNPTGTKYFVGTIIQVDRSLGKKLQEDKIAEVYTGPYPPVGKLKVKL